MNATTADRLTDLVMHGFPDIVGLLDDLTMRPEVERTPALRGALADIERRIRALWDQVEEAADEAQHVE